MKTIVSWPLLKNQLKQFTFTKQLLAVRIYKAIVSCSHLQNNCKLAIFKKTN